MIGTILPSQISNPTFLVAKGFLTILVSDDKAEGCGTLLLILLVAEIESKPAKY